MIATLTAPIGAHRVSDGLPVLILALAIGDGTFAIYCDDEGRLRHDAIENVVLDWRYDWTSHRWLEVAGVENAEEGFAPDGSEEVQGRIPNVDWSGEGDPLDQEGGAPAGDPGGLDTGEES